MPKNIVLCLDGTGQQFSNCNSNVVRLYTALCTSGEQATYYHPGLGTMGAPTAQTPLGRFVTKIAGLAFGMGFLDNVADAYRFLMSTYAEGDRIYLFGFSRGAYTARALAGALSMYGLLCPGNEGHLPYLLASYSKASRDAYRRRSTRMHHDMLSEAFKVTFSRAVPIHFLGVWDTVSSIGWVYDPVKLLFDGQNPAVARARHAVSISERRCFYQDNLLGKALRPAATPLLSGAQQDILQVWFPGVHSDVGGSYAQEEASPALESLAWMLREAEAAGILLNEDRRNLVLGQHTEAIPIPELRVLNHRPKPLESLHNSLYGVAARNGPAQLRNAGGQGQVAVAARPTRAGGARRELCAPIRG